MTATSLTPKVFVQTSNDIFFDKPPFLNINEDAHSEYATKSKIEVLIKELQTQGPLVGLGQNGPTAYVDEPFKLNEKLFGKDIYGWKAGAERNNTKNCYFIILGAQKKEERELVYFTLSEDVTSDKETYLRTHIPSRIDKKIYVTSHKTFLNYLCDLYPPSKVQSSKDWETLQPLSGEEYIEQLSAIRPLDAILDRGPVEKRCKAIGQEIFDKYKEEAGGNSNAGRKAVVNICDSIGTHAIDGSLRKQYIERAWDGIGDSNWRWRA